MRRPGDPIATGEADGQPPAARRAWVLLLALFFVALAAYIVARGWDPDPDATGGPAPGVIAGTPGGMVASEEPAPTLESAAGVEEASLAPDPTLSPAAEPTAAPSTPAAEPTAAQPTPSPPRPAETATPPPPPPATPPPATPPPATPPPATPPPPTPAPVVAVASGPDDAVAAFYRYVADGDFDAAYALWSDRMKAVYPKRENLDGRFADTASISFSQLSVAAQSGDEATVQANFTEHYDGGGSREFIGYWRLIRVGGAWLLDEPTY